MNKLKSFIKKLRPQRLSSDPILESDILYRKEKAKNDLLESELEEYKEFFRKFNKLMEK